VIQVLVPRNHSPDGVFGIRLCEREGIHMRGKIETRRCATTPDYRGNNPRRKNDLPVRLTVIGAGKRSFRFLIHRQGGMVLEASPVSYSSETAAREAGLPAMRRHNKLLS